jgi:type IV secretory pathway VirB4 component
MSILVIDELYLREAFRIMNAFNEQVKVTNRYKLMIVEQYKVLENTEASLKELLKVKAADTDKEQELHDIMTYLHDGIYKIQSKFKALNRDKLELEKSSKLLYDVIKERYPNKSDEELQIAIGIGINNLKSLGKL